MDKMKAINMPASEGFNFEDHERLSELYGETVYTRLSDVIRMNTKVARGGLGSCNSHNYDYMMGDRSE